MPLISVDPHDTLLPGVKSRSHSTRLDPRRPETEVPVDESTLDQGVHSTRRCSPDDPLLRLFGRDWWGRPTLRFRLGRRRGSRKVPLLTETISDAYSPKLLFSLTPQRGGPPVCRDPVSPCTHTPFTQSSTLPEWGDTATSASRVKVRVSTGKFGIRPATPEPARCP